MIGGGRGGEPEPFPLFQLQQRRMDWGPALYSPMTKSEDAKLKKYFFVPFN